MTYEIHYRDGTKSDFFATYTDAIQPLVARYGNEVAICKNWDNCGEDEDGNTPQRKLVWANPDVADNDDGSKAVAEIIRRD